VVPAEWIHTYTGFEDGPWGMAIDAVAVRETSRGEPGFVISEGAAVGVLLMLCVHRGVALCAKRTGHDFGKVRALAYTQGEIAWAGIHLPRFHRLAGMNW